MIGGGLFTCRFFTTTVLGDDTGFLIDFGYMSKLDKICRLLMGVVAPVVYSTKIGSC